MNKLLSVLMMAMLLASGAATAGQVVLSTLNGYGVTTSTSFNSVFMTKVSARAPPKIATTPGVMRSLRIRKILAL